MDFIRSYQASWVGHLIDRPTTQSYEAKIFGSTSRGLFLRSPSAGILFISYETHPGPLSVNLACLPPTGRLEAQTNQIAEVSPAQIRLPSGQQIHLEEAAVWRPAPLPAARAGRFMRTQALREVARLAGEQKSADSLIPLLVQVLDLPRLPLPAWQKPFERAWVELSNNSFRLGLLSAREPLEAVLGLGRGLTPSGDDFLCGLLLGLNRLVPSEQPSQARELSVLLTQAAAQRTTALSAALIRAASLGSADQRLVSAWDGLLCSTLLPPEIFQSLAAFGSSSGIDALAGFAAASALIKD